MRTLVPVRELGKHEADFRAYLARRTLAAAHGRRNEPAGALAWRDWLATYFAPYVWATPAPRHVRLWEWFEQLAPGVRPRPRVECWPRGGAKSASAELGCTRLGARLSRRYVLYCSETQAQADRHVQAIASMLEHLGIGRATNEYGTSKGWRREELRTQSGFNVTAFGLDVGLRGAKLDQFRPDLIIFDDVDSLHDSAATRQKKIDLITNTILPAGSNDCAVLVLQNLVYADSIMAQLASGRADFLSDREVFIEPAVQDLEFARVETDEGVSYRITAGTPTWAGQDLTVCEANIKSWGLTAFLAEAQHNVQARAGAMVRREDFPIIDRPAVLSLPRVRYWDFAATEPGPMHPDPDFSAGALVMDNPPFYDIVEIAYTRAAPAGVERLVTQTVQLPSDRQLADVVIEQEPGAASVHTIRYYRELLGSYGLSPDRVLPDRVSTRKDLRAQPVAALAGKGLVRLVRGEWNALFLDQAVAFPGGAHDDLWDAVVGAVNYLSQRAQSAAGGTPATARRRTAGY